MYKKASNLPDSYIVVSNHVTDYDPLFVAASFSNPMYFVGSEHIARWKVAYKFLKFAFAPILRYKGASAIHTVIEIIKQIKKGSNICIFAEGVRTWDGVTCPIPASTAKLIQKAGCGLVTYKIVGGYFTSPMWCGKRIRKGAICGAPVNVYTREQLNRMTTEEIHAVIRNDLHEDAYERQMTAPQPYRGKHLAEHLEYLQFICPTCGNRDTFRSFHDTVSCCVCELSFRYDEYGMLDGVPFKTVKEFSDWQRAQVLADLDYGAVYTADEATLSTVSHHKETLVAQGKVTSSTHALTCGDMEFMLKDISHMAMHGQRAIVFTSNQVYYELIPAKESNALKFLLFFDGYKNRIKTES